MKKKKILPDYLPSYQERRVNQKDTLSSLTGKKILIVGVEESERDSLVEMVLKRNKKFLPHLTFARLPDFSHLPVKRIKAKRKAFYKEFEKVLKRKGHLVLSGSLTFKTPLGFTPLFTTPLFTPDLTILLELDTREAVIVPGYGIARRKVDRRGIRFQQELNRYYAILLLSPLKILPVDRGNIKKALRELKEVVQIALQG